MDRFRLRKGVLRLESEGDSFLIGSTVWGILPLPISEYRYLRFVVKIDEIPIGAKLWDEEVDDSALRIVTVFRKSPPQSIVYVWSWDLPVGSWSARSRSILGDFRSVHRKSFGQGKSAPGQWLTVEVNLWADYHARFPEAAEKLESPPILRGIALKADSNDVSDGRSLAWIRSLSFHRESLHDQNIAEGDALGDTVVWYR